MRIFRPIVQQGIVVHTYGIGKRPPREGSVIAWADLTNRRHLVKVIDGLCPHQADARAKHATEGSFVHIYCSSRIVAKVFNYDFEYQLVNDVRFEITEVIRESKLTIKVWWLPRQHNHAYTLIRERRKNER